jgi:prephenate dehydrogenase
VKVGVAGLGLIGGSIALALHDKHDVLAFDTDDDTRAAASRSRLTVVADLAALCEADVVVIATPLPDIVPTLERLSASTGAVLVDTGSLKRAVVDYAARAPATARIVGGHPMAGATSSGFSAADPDLFRGRPFLLVPTERSDDGAMGLAGAVARACGGVVTVCSSEVHDRAMARLIVAPLASAAALAVAGAQADPLVGAAGPGFRDSTRLADTALDLATDLLFANVKDSGAAIDSVIDGLEQLRERIEGGDREYVRSFLQAAQSVRERLHASSEST